MSAAAEFPIPLSHYKAIPLDPKNPKLTAEQRETLKKNIDICRDAIVFFTAIADAKGLGGHTGGPFDTVPEVVIMHGFMKHAEAGGTPDVLPVFFDEAGHRVATQYLMAVLEGELPLKSCTTTANTCLICPAIRNAVSLPASSSRPVDSVTCGRS